MIPRNYILEWAEFVPWANLLQIEQDLIITRSLLQIYSHSILKKSLAFRGGTALNKLIFNPPSRYSEDIDLVQVTTESIGATINQLREVMDWLGTPKRSFSDGGATLLYRTISHDGFPIKLKIEINTREHFNVLGLKEYSFSSNSTWSPGDVTILSYNAEELLGTKMRALYQRRKGRDLYDLYMSLTTIEGLDSNAIVNCFKEYISYSDNPVSKKEFINNMENKIKNKEFREDIIPLLPQRIETFNPDVAYELILNHLIEKL